MSTGDQACPMWPGWWSNVQLGDKKCSRWGIVIPSDPSIRRQKPSSGGAEKNLAGIRAQPSQCGIRAAHIPVGIWSSGQGHRGRTLVMPTEPGQWWVGKGLAEFSTSPQEQSRCPTKFCWVIQHKLATVSMSVSSCHVTKHPKTL